MIVAHLRTTIGETRDLPAVLTTEQAAALLGVGRDHLWALAREGSAPIEPLRLGRALRWPTAPLLTLLGLTQNADEPSVGPEGSITDPIDATLKSRGSGAG